MAKRTAEELCEELCDHCPLPEESKGVHLTPNGPSMCEGRRCEEAYAAYMESDSDEEDE